MRKVYTITGPWQFQMDVPELGEREAWFSKSHNRRNWTKVTVPGAWDCYDEALWGYEGVGWYTTTIKPASIRAGCVQALVFSRAMYHTKVWVNGTSVGENLGGYLPFRFDVTSLLNSGKTNLLVVRVNNRYRSDWLPAAELVEWVQYGGILEPVRIVNTPPVCLADLSINAVPEGHGARVSSLVEILNRTDTPVEGTLCISVTAAKTQKTSSVPVQCPAGTNISQTIPLHLDRAGSWSPDSPSLHTATVTLKVAGKAVDKITERFGVRSIAVRGRQILLNGKPVTIKGVNRYDEYGRFGPNPSVELVRKELKLLKSTGVNCIRIHYPQSPELLSLYDELGFMLFEEVPICWWGNNWWGGKPPKQSLDILGPAGEALEKMIHRDRNNPCVIAWSMCNESKTSTRVGIEVMRELMKRARQLDPTRLVTFVVAGDTKEHKAFADADIVCTNIYYGLHMGTVAHHLNELDKLTYRPSMQHLKKQLSYWPDKPVVVTEYGMRGIPGISGDVDYSEDFQAEYIRLVWEAIGEVDGVCGGHLWSWADYYHRRDLVNYAVFGPYGVVTVDRKPKKALRTLGKIYRER